MIGITNPLRWPSSLLIHLQGYSSAKPEHSKGGFAITKDRFETKKIVAILKQVRAGSPTPN